MRSAIPRRTVLGALGAGAALALGNEVLAQPPRGERAEPQRPDRRAVWASKVGAV